MIQIKALACQFLPIMFVSFFVVYFFTPLVQRMSMRLGVIDTPSERKVHTKPTAKLGGIAI